MRKILFIVIDGLGDRQIPELGNKTPLEAAKKPNLDWLAKNGICGLIRPFKFSSQEYPASDTAHLALFGYDPEVYYLGRGPYEAAGVGIDLKEGDVALRANFAAVDDNLLVIDRRAGRIEKTQTLVKALSRIKIKGVSILLKKSFGHRLAVVLRGKNLSSRISDSDPKKEGLEAKKILPLDKSASVKATADFLNKFLSEAYVILSSHPLNKKREKEGKLPANYILTRGAGFLKKTPSFRERYGMFSACIAGGGLYKGIGKILGMDQIEVKGATGFPTTNLKGKIFAAKKALFPVKSAKSGAKQSSGLKKYDFVFLHIKAADNLGEDGNCNGKKIFIEKIDKALSGILNLKQTLIAITADHSTCCSLKRHCLESVPVLIYGGGADAVREFSEKACLAGELGEISGLDLMPRILNIKNSNK